MTKRNVLNSTWEPISREEDRLISQYKKGEITMQELRERYPQDILDSWHKHFKPSGIFSRFVKQNRE